MSNDIAALVLCSRNLVVATIYHYADIYDKMTSKLRVGVSTSKTSLVLIFYKKIAATKININLQKWQF